MGSINHSRCLFCCKVHSCILLSITISLFLVLSYGYEYWVDYSIWKEPSNHFCGYLILVGIEFLFSSIGWIGIYHHIRFIASSYTYWVLLHIPLNVIIFWMSPILHHFHLVIFIVWTLFQILILILLRKYKKV